MHTAKLFMNGRSQAVRLPANFRFDCDEVYIRQDPKTKNLIISEKPNSWDDFFALVAKHPVPDDFMAERDHNPLVDKDLF